MTRYFLGVDGGGTNCRIRLADESLTTLGEGRGGPSNLQILNGEPAYRSILAGTEAAFAAAGLGSDAFSKTYACFCMAGGRSVSDRDAFARRPWPFAAVRVYDDIDAAHAGALGGHEGAVIIAGTGSAALAIVDGQRHQAGGWGFHIGDQMSGAILGRELVRYAVEAADGLRDGSPLCEAVIAKLGGSLDTVMAWSFADRRPADYGALMPLFFEYYEKSDSVAQKMMDIELGAIDAYVKWFKARGVMRLAVIGGFGERLYPLLVERYGDFMVKARHEPLHGAIILAQQNFGAQ